MLEFARRTRADFARLLMEYQFAVDEVSTKISILRREFLHLHSYNPIEHVTTRVKSVESIFEKLLRKGFEPTIASARENLTDIGGVRIICSFIADTYRVMGALTKQNDLRIVTVKDYIKQPKPNGYKSLHLLVEVPVFLSSGPLPLTVEVQIRTIAMDFWASLEHKIYYKYSGDVPAHLVESLTEAADLAEQLDVRMEQLHSQVHGSGGADVPRGGMLDESVVRRMWQQSRHASPGGPISS
ncbi:MAG: GTP pyrophosphokinase family protein [Nakamurella sp.]